MTQALCDLVLLSWNHLEETQPCLESLFTGTDVPARLLIVDNASEPPVRRFLSAVKPRGAIAEVVYLQNETNEGFPRGMNRGIRVSNAPFVCLLNNDLRVTPGWLEALIEVAERHQEIGVVNPTSNTFGNVPPKGMSLEAYALSRRSLQSRYTEVGMCIGFCMLIKREVIVRLGGLSEEVERCFFEDEDFSMRAQAAGYRCVVAEASYVYHAEHQSVRELPEREAIFARNRRWCEERWGRRLRLAWPQFQPPVPGSPALRDRLQQWVGWARRRTHVYVYCPTPAPWSPEALFRSVDLVPHADIHWFSLPEGLARLAAMGHVLKRRKKPFDLIVAPDAAWAKAMRRLHWAHRAAVVEEGDGARLLAEWQRRRAVPPSAPSM